MKSGKAAKMEHSLSKSMVLGSGEAVLGEIGNKKVGERLYASLNVH